MFYLLPNELQSLIFTYFDEELLMIVYSIMDNNMIYGEINNRIRSSSITLKTIIKSNNMSIIKLYESYQFYLNLDKCLQYSVKYEYIQLIEYFMYKNPKEDLDSNSKNFTCYCKNLSPVLIFCAKYNNNMLFDIFLKKVDVNSVINDKKILKYATKNNNREIIDLYLSFRHTMKKFEKIKHVLYYAAVNNNRELIDYMVTKIKELQLSKPQKNYREEWYWNNILAGACVHKHDELIMEGIEKASKWYYTEISNCAKNGHYNLMRYFLLNRKRNDNYLICTTMNKIVQRGYYDIVEYLLSKGHFSKTDADEGLKYAVLGNHPNIVDLLISYGTNYCYDGLEGAIQSNNMYWLEFFLNKIQKPNWDKFRN